MEAFAPGVEILEREAFPSISGVGTSFSGMAARSGRGPDDRVTLMSDIGQYERRYGGPDGNYGWPESNGYFDQEGVGLYYIRVLGDGAAVAELDLWTIDPTEEVQAITALGQPSGAPVPITIVGHGWDTGLRVAIGGVSGLTPSIAGVYTITKVDDDIFTLDGTDGDDYTGVPVLTAATATGNEATGQLQTSSVGEWGNNTFITIQKYTTALNAVAAPAQPVIEVESIVGLEIGDVVVVQEGAELLTSIIVDIDSGTRLVTLRHNVPAAGFTAAATVNSTSTHKTKTTLAQAYTSGAQVIVSSAATITKGTLLLLVSSNGDRVAEVKVSALNGTTLTVTETWADGAIEIPAGSSVVSDNFDVSHFVDGDGATYPNLALEVENPVDYFVTALAQTEYLRGIPNVATPATYKAFVYPRVVVNSAMYNGLEGAAPQDWDYTGTNPNKPYTHGYKLFDNVQNLPQFAVPGSSVVIQKAADSYTQGRNETLHVCDAPLAADTLEELQAYRNVTLNLASSHSALYAPWLLESDPLLPGAQVLLPPSGRVLGVYSEVSARRGTMKAPANEAIVSVLDVSARFKKEEHAILNASGVNLITNVEGRGIRVMGARTLWPNADRKQFVNVRRILNAVKAGLKVFGESITFEPNDDLLWTNVQKEGTAYLEQLWKQGWFFPRNKPDEAFFFRCDKTTNTEALRKAGKVRSIVGINPVLPGELIIFEVTLWDGGSNIEELI